MVNLQTLSSHLKQNEYNIWTSKEIADIHWPECAHKTTFTIDTTSFWFAHRNKCVLTTLSLFPPKGSIFDVGGGNGLMSTQLRAAGYKTVILEPTAEGVKNAMARQLHPIVYSSFEEAQFKDSSIPAIGLFDVIEHIPNDIAFLKTAHRVLEPQGKLYITVPASNLLWSAKDEYVGHCRRYNLNQLTHTLRQIGFHIDFSTYLFSILVLPTFFLKALPTRLGLSRKYTPEKHKQDHLKNDGRIQKFLKPFFNAELRRIRKRKSISFGSSCLVVATRS